MFGECHAHIFLNGRNYKEAVLSRNQATTKRPARASLFAIKYVEHLINGTHDSSCSHHHRLWIFHFFCL